jgi:hypothetical protein
MGVAGNSDTLTIPLKKQKVGCIWPTEYGLLILEGMKSCF